MFTNQPPQHQQPWYTNQQTHAPAQQYAYGQQLPPTPVGPRYDRPGMNNQSKQALSHMLRLRLPSNQLISSQQQPSAAPVAGPGAFQGMQRQQFIRHQLRAQHGAPNINPQQGMFASQQQQQQSQQQQSPQQSQTQTQCHSTTTGIQHTGTPVQQLVTSTSAVMDRQVPIQITLPPQTGVPDAPLRVLTIQVPASAIQGKLQLFSYDN